MQAARQRRNRISNRGIIWQLYEQRSKRAWPTCDEQIATLRRKGERLADGGVEWQRFAAASNG